MDGVFQLCNHPLCSALSCVLWRRSPYWYFFEIEFFNRRFVIGGGGGGGLGGDPPPHDIYACQRPSRFSDQWDLSDSSRTPRERTNRPLKPSFPSHPILTILTGVSGGFVWFQAILCEWHEAYMKKLATISSVGTDDTL